MKSFSLAVAILAFTPLFALADWSATLHAQGSHGSIQAKIWNAGKKMRMQMDVGGQQVNTFIHFDTRKSHTLIDLTKQYVETDFNQTATQLAPCTGQDVDACFKKEGFKKAGSEAFDGHPCDIYEGSVTVEGAPRKARLWRSTQHKDIPPLKTVLSNADGSPYAEMSFRNLTVAPIPKERFEIPKGYTKAAGTFSGF